MESWMGLGMSLTMLCIQVNLSQYDTCFLQPSCFPPTTPERNVLLAWDSWDLIILISFLTSQKRKMRKQSTETGEKNLGERTRSSQAEGRLGTWDYQLVVQQWRQRLIVGSRLKNFRSSQSKIILVYLVLLIWSYKVFHFQINHLALCYMWTSTYKFLYIYWLYLCTHVDTSGLDLASSTSFMDYRTTMHFGPVLFWTNCDYGIPLRLHKISHVLCTTYFNQYNTQRSTTLTPQ